MPKTLHTSRSLRGSLLLFFALLLCAPAFGQLTVTVTGEDISCFGLSSGTATAAVSDGDAPYTYLWSNGGNTSTITNLTAGTYGVTVTDNNGLIGSGMVTLTEPTRVTATITDPTECDGPYTIAAEPEGGQIPYTFNWSTGADTRAVSVPAGDYCVTVVDANLCGYVACTVINPNPPSVTLVDVDITCNGADDGAITANPAGGVPPYTYAWTGGLTGQTITALAPGAYRVTLTDSRGCTATATTLINQPDQLIGEIFGDQTVCPGVVDAFIRIAPSGGTPPYTYLWSPGGATGQGIGAVGAGTYSVTVTDANDCTLVDTYEVIESPEVEIEIIGDLLLCGANTTGTLSANPLSGPVSQYTYEWSTGATSPSITGIGAGNYSVTATDVNGCTGSATATVRTIDLNLSLTSTPLTCADSDDGTATATATGGDMPYTYMWSNGETTATITGLAAGVYGVTVTEANNCKVSGNVLVSAPAPLVISATPGNVSCEGADDGTIDVTVSGGTLAYTYLWSDGATTEDRTGLAAGNYGVTVTDANGCTANTSVQITAPDALVVTPTIVNVACAGESTGAITLAVSGGTPAYSYAWSTGATTRIISGLAAGDYTVTVTDANECTLTATYTVTAPPALVVTGVSTNIDCFGDNDGAIDLTVSGGTPAYSYAWSNGATTEDISGLAAGAYRVTVTDNNECSEINTFTITEPTDLVVGATPSNVSCAGADDGAINATVSGGTQPYTFAWSNGAVTEDLSGLAAGTYTLTVTDANGCTETATVQVTAPSALVVTPSITDVNCAGDSDGSISLTVSGGTPAYSYAWSTGATTRILIGLAAGDYTVTVTDANDCTLTATYTVTAPLALVVTGATTNIDCFGDNDGAIDLTVSGGTPAYSYAWSNGATTEDISGLAAGAYRVTVTDNNECSEINTFTITEPTDLVVGATPSNVSCAGADDGAINATVSGGTQPYTFAWSNGAVTEDLSGLAAGTYTLTVTDANGCTETATVQVTAPSALVVTPSITNVNCAGDSDGSISLTVSGGTPAYSYAWSTGATTRILIGLAAGDYTVTVTDANDCTLTATYTVTAPPALVVTGATTNIDCFGDNDGAIDLTVSGGSPGYNIAWSNGASSEDISGLGAGDYTVTVTDANECTETRAFTIIEPTDLVLSAVPTNVSCNGDNDGAIDASTSGGTQPYTFSWSNGATTEDLSNLVAGTYTLTVTDANGCTETVTTTVREPLALNGFAEITRVACTGEATGSINLTAERGTAPYTFSWSNGATTEDISDLAAGMYTVTITDANNCILVQTYEVGTVDGIVIDGVVTSVTCNGDSDGSIDVTVSGGFGPYAYTWSNGALVEDISGLPAGDYTVTVTDANECSIEATFTVTEPDAIDLTVTAPNIVCGGTNSGVITVFPAGGTEPYTYLWSNGDTGNMIDNIPAGNYTVTVTDANGCTDVTNGIVLSELPQLTCEVVIDQQSTDGTNGQLSVNVDGGTQPFTYVWSNGATTPTISNLAAGTYSVTVTDFSGCTTECNATLRALSGIGDFVWVDSNFNGQQDPGEPGLADYPVYLKDAAGMIIDSTRTDADGLYAFMGLEPGTYSILFIEPQGGDRTLFNVGNDATDNDADPSMGGMTQNYTLAPGEFNMTVDAGFIVGIDGPILDPCNCLNNNTTNADGQFLEVFEIIAGPGQTWTIVDQENLYLLESEDGTSPPELPTLVPLGAELVAIGDADPDPVFGRRVRYSFSARLIDSLAYSVTASNGIQEFSITNQCFYPDVNFVEVPPAEICRFEAAYLLEGFGELNGEEIPGRTVFTINGVTATEINPMTLPLGTYTITGEFLPDPPFDQAGIDICRPRLERTFILIDDCDAKLGDFVWQDTNGNGLQDPGEPGIEGVKVTVTSQDGSYMDMAFTDATGMYMFSVPPGTYKMTFDAPDDFVPTTANTGNDELDSDMDPVMLMTGFYTVGPDEMDFSIDAGFINPCISNIVNPGTIAASQEICGPGNVPQPLVEIAPATGGEGNIQYLWMFNTEDPTQPISFWQPIPNSNTPNYAPGLIYETTYFTRCVRRNNCQYLESNVITIEVGDDAVAEVSGPNVVCVGEQAIFQAVNPGNGASISWSFTGSSAVENATGATVTTSWATFGSFSATLTVTANGCTSTRIFNVAVVNNPSRCGGNLTANGAVNNLLTRDVTIEWQVPADGTDYDFVLERSTNGIDFTDVASVSVPAFVSGNDMAMFRQNDISPLAGRTFYRVRMVDAQYGDMLSNVVEMQLASTSSSALGRIFPNPATNGMIHVEMTEMSTEENRISVELFDVRGNMPASRIFVEPGTGVINLPISSGATGLYLLRITRGEQTETHRVIIN